MGVGTHIKLGLAQIMSAMAEKRNLKSNALEILQRRGYFMTTQLTFLQMSCADYGEPYMYIGLGNVDY